MQTTAAITPAERRKMEDICRVIAAHGDGPLPLKYLAARAGLSAFHFQRRFKAVIGVSPRDYLEACRMKTLKKNLRDGGRVTDAIYDAGFGAPSRVYARTSAQLGMTPRQYGRKGEGLAISYASARTPLGLMMIGATDKGICLIQFGDSEDALLAMLAAEFPQAVLAPMDKNSTALFRDWMKALNAYLGGAEKRLDLPLDIRGTAFQTKVWKYLQRIPHGATMSYAEVARAMGQPKSARAVATACAANRIAIAIPCHRVIRGDGSLSGYKWVPERKKKLLSLEQGA